MSVVDSISFQNSPTYEIHRLGSFTAHVFNCIRDVPRDEWDELALQRSLTFAHAFWEVVENSRLNDFSYRHAMIYAQDGTLAAITSFYTVTTDTAIFARGRLRTVLARIRRVWPGFLMLRMLECGTPVTINSPSYVIADGQPVESVITALDTLFQRYARRDRTILIVVRDFESNSLAHQTIFTRLRYTLLRSLPNTYLAIPWRHGQDYLNALKSYYRSKQLKHVKRVEAQGIRCEPCADFASLSETLCEQWLVVHHGADEAAREVLTPEFYRGLAHACGGKAQVLLFYQGDTLVGHTLMLRDGAKMRWLYFGRANAVNDSLYIYAMHHVIQAAIRSGAPLLELGLTTYPVKLDLGASPVEMSHAIRCTIGAVNFVIPWLYPLINHVPEVTPKVVFKAAGTVIGRD